MRTITLEEHFTTTEFLKATGQDSRRMNSWMLAVNSRLLDIGKGRIADMDANHIDMQVLSLSSAGLYNLDAAIATPLIRNINNQLAEVVSDYPERFSAFATVALQDTQQAVKELERCIKKLQFKGLMVMGTVNGVFLDDPRFIPVFEAVQALDIPIYMHPGFPPKAVTDAYYSGMPPAINFGLSMAGWGWHAETGLHCLRLMLSGIFDRFPKLRIIVGHMGDHLPFNIARADRVFSGMANDDGNLPFGRRLMDYFRENFYITTSGYFDIAPFDCAYGILGPDHILFSVDYPYASNADGYKFLNMLPVSLEEREKIAHKNADHLLKLEILSAQF